MKNRHHTISIVLIISLAVLLAACRAQSPMVQEPASTHQAEMENESTVKDDAGSIQVSYPNLWVEEVPRLDEQGAVVVEIVPLNPNNPGQTLDFSVALNTHSVDLSMDLATLATLETDTGHSVQATHWDAPRGGHHIRGILSFPAGVDGNPILEGVTKMIITLVDLDAPERIFVWER